LSNPLLELLCSSCVLLFQLLDLLLQLIRLLRLSRKSGQGNHSRATQERNKIPFPATNCDSHLIQISSAVFQATQKRSHAALPHFHLAFEIPFAVCLPA